MESPETYHELVPVTVPVSGVKELRNRPLTSGDVFTFLLREESTGTIYREAMTQVQDGGNTTAFSFDPALAFSKAGTYRFIIEEKPATQQSISHDAVPVLLTVTIANQNGRLVLQSTAYTKGGTAVDTPSFVNEFQATSHSFVKRWVVPEGEVAETPPDIQVQLYQGDTVLDEITLVHPQVTYTWDGLPKYDMNGNQHVYSAREVSPPRHYQSYVDKDGATVNVYRRGTFSANKLWKGKAPEPGSMDVQLMLYKTIMNDISETPYRVPVELVTLDGVADMHKLEGLPEGSVPASWEAAPWQWQWNELVAGDLVTRTVTYHVPAEQPGDPPVEMTEEVTAYVSFEYHIEELVPPEGYVIDATSSASTYVTNVYAPAPIDIVATKTWVGGELADHTAVPLVLVRSLPGEPPVPVDQKPDITGTAPNFEYTWHQLAVANEEGVTYLYEVMEEGALADLVLVNGHTYAVTQEAYDIVNRYQPPTPVEIVLSAKKTLQGGEISAGQFSFELVGEGVRLTATNDAQGLVAFGPLALNTMGDYDFEIKELAGSSDLMAYDRNHYTAHVEVTHNEGANRLEASITWLMDGAPIEGDMPLFVNKLGSPAPAHDPVQVHIMGHKRTINHPLRAGAYQFVIKDAQGNVLETVTNQQDGSIAFTPRSFSRTGTFLYTVAEVQGDDQGIAYDSSIYGLRVRVQADGGRLHADVQISKDGVPASSIQFVNQAKLPPTGDRGLALPALLAAGALLLLAGARYVLKRRS